MSALLLGRRESSSPSRLPRMFFIQFAHKLLVARVLFRSLPQPSFHKNTSKSDPEIASGKPSFIPVKYRRNASLPDYGRDKIRIKNRAIKKRPSRLPQLFIRVMKICFVHILGRRTPGLLNDDYGYFTWRPYFFPADHLHY